MNNKLLGLIGIIVLNGAGYNTASAVVVNTPQYNSLARAHTVIDNNISENDPVSSTSSAAWPSASSGFLQANATASGLSLNSSSIGIVKSAGAPPLPTNGNQTLAQSKFVIPVEVTAAGFGSLTFSWNGTLDYHTDVSGSAFYSINGSTTDNPGDFVSAGPANPNSPNAAKNGSLGPNSAQDSLAFNEQQSVFWDFQADDIGKVFNVNFDARAILNINNLEEALGAGTAGALVGGATISASLLFGSNGVLAPVGVTAVPIPAAVWLFGSALLGLFGINKRKVSL
jgi:hypothetical protein